MLFWKKSRKLHLRKIKYRQFFTDLRPWGGTVLEIATRHKNHRLQKPPFAFERVRIIAFGDFAGNRTTASFRSASCWRATHWTQLRHAVKETSKTPSMPSKIMSSSRYESQKSHPVQVKSRTLQKSKVAGYRSQLQVLASSRRRLRRLRSHTLFPIVAKFICFSVSHKSKKQPELLVNNDPVQSSVVAFEWNEDMVQIWISR